MRYKFLTVTRSQLLLSFGRWIMTLSVVLNVTSATADASSQITQEMQSQWCDSNASHHESTPAYSRGHCAASGFEMDIMVSGFETIKGAAIVVAQQGEKTKRGSRLRRQGGDPLPWSEILKKDQQYDPRPHPWILEQQPGDNIFGPNPLAPGPLHPGTSSGQEQRTDTQDPEVVAAKNLLIEVNGIETAENRCRVSFLIENKSHISVESIKLDFVAFDAAGAILRRFLAEMGPVRASKTILRTFPVDAECQQLGAILVNEVTVCKPDELGDCLDSLALSSRVTTIRLYK
jgi:hypothetical protein